MRTLALILAFAAGERPALSDVKAWAIQLQGLDRGGAVAALAASETDLLVIDPTRGVRGQERFKTRDVVRALSRDRLVLAYLNVGQAEEYRTYWRAHWKAPTSGAPGEPPYLLATDPDGWPQNYPVAYWDFRWRAVLWGSPGAPLDEILDDGFHGVYLDWVAGFEHEPVVAAARAAGVDPAKAMVELVRDLKEYARRRDPRFLVIVQNAARLAELRPELCGIADGFSEECVSFRGDAAVAWDDARSGDVAIPATGDWSTETKLARIRALRARGAFVLTLDYARDPENAETARTRSRTAGAIPFVSRTPLDRLY